MPTPEEILAETMADEVDREIERCRREGIKDNDIVPNTLRWVVKGHGVVDSDDFSWYQSQIIKIRAARDAERKKKEELQRQVADAQKVIQEEEARGGFLPDD